MPCVKGALGNRKLTGGLQKRDERGDDKLLEIECRWFKSSKNSSVSETREPKTSLGDIVPCTAIEFERVSIK